MDWLCHPGLHTDPGIFASGTTMVQPSGFDMVQIPSTSYKSSFFYVLFETEKIASSQSLRHILIIVLSKGSLFLHGSTDLNPYSYNFLFQLRSQKPDSSSVAIRQQKWQF